MNLNFSNEIYKEKAKHSLGYGLIKCGKRASEAFMQLIKDVSKEDLSNLCEKIQINLSGKIELTLETCYNITQGDISGIEELESKLNGKTLAELILMLAYECIEDPEEGRVVHLGEKTINDGKINTSSWISHSLYEAKVAQRLAEKLEADSEKAQTMALLHDYGRKATHNFTHVISGFEMLVDIGWEAEARSSLTHSFINGGRCAHCDAAVDGFYINEKGKPAWQEGVVLDDMMEVLNCIQYDVYDEIVNVADLMATSFGITTPYDRVLDVATRKTTDIRNRVYFLSEFTNLLLKVMKSDQKRSNALMSIEEAEKRLKEVSDEFYNFIYAN